MLYYDCHSCLFNCKEETRVTPRSTFQHVLGLCRLSTAVVSIPVRKNQSELSNKRSMGQNVPAVWLEDVSILCGNVRVHKLILTTRKLHGPLVNLATSRPKKLCFKRFMMHRPAYPFLRLPSRPRGHYVGASTSRTSSGNKSGFLQYSSNISQSDLACGSLGQEGNRWRWRVGTIS